MIDDDPNYRCYASVMLAVLRYVGIAAALVAAAILGCIIGR
jgi:hypothetical protein